MTTVSVITPLFNGSAHIEDCISSVADQNFSDLEHIVIDNNSTDDGPDRVRELQKAHPHLRLMSETTKGAGPARNAGIRAAKGRYIAFLDADDRWKSDKLAVQISAMQEADAAFSWTGYDVIKDGEFARVQSAPASVSYQDLLSKRATIGCLTVIYDAEKIGKRFMNDMPMRQDFCLWLDILSDCEKEGWRCLGLPESLALYQVHAGGMTADKRKAARMQWRAYRRHVGLSRFRTAELFTSYAFHALAARLGRSSEKNPEEPRRKIRSATLEK